MVAITKETLNGPIKEQKPQGSSVLIEEERTIVTGSVRPKRRRKKTLGKSETLALVITIATVLAICSRCRGKIGALPPQQQGSNTTTGAHNGSDNISTDQGGSRSVFIPPYALSDAFIREINSKASSWQAGRNFPEETPTNYFFSMMKSREEPSLKHLRATLAAQRPSLSLDEPLPIDFDGRTKWPHCKGLFEIRDQGGCGSCWAIGSVETMADRQCIHKNETFHYSTEDLMTCCEYCGDGCNGGSSYNAFNWWHTAGLVSGGPYGSNQGCMPYLLKPCEHHISGRRPACRESVNPYCQRNCVSSYNKTYTEDLHRAKSVYTHDNESEILKELFTRGPMTGSFYVYEDYLHYKSGVYHHVAGGSVGIHVIKVIGFGVEGGVPYYLCANSWNYDWGDGGFFKIRRDQLSSVMVTGIPA